MTTEKPIRVLIVEDSEVIAYLLRSIFESQDDIEVVGRAANGQEAIEMVPKLKPTIITMDIRMPKMDGFEATKYIMMNFPTPIIVISSSVDSIELNIAFNALAEGALMVMEKPENVQYDGFKQAERELLENIRAFSGMHVIRRREIKQPNKTEILKPKSRAIDCQLVALGISTGGPEALNYILENIPADFPVPIVIVQHMTKSFLPGLVSWLTKFTDLKVKLAEDNEILQPGTVYFAPDSYHLNIKANRGVLTALLVDKPPVDSFKPSVTELFSSIAQSLPGKAMAGLLTGMGRDGAAGLLSMHHQNCLTFVQDKKSCVVFGMPEVALELNATDNVVALKDIPNFILRNI